MADFTALQIVNRIARQMNLVDYADFTTQRAKALLDLANEAKDIVLESRMWDFDQRDNGVLVTQAQVTTGTLNLTNGQTAFTTSASGALQTGNVTRLLVTSDDSYSTTAVRVVNHENTDGVLDAAWVGDTDTVATYKALVYEYALPSTVKDVTSVRFQDDEIELCQIAGNNFYSAIPRPTDRITDNPEVVYVGSQVVPTYVTSAGASGPSLGMLIHPVPLTAYRLEYSYTVRHPTMTASQDLEGVPEYVVHDIVTEALALAHASNIGNDPELSDRLRRMTEIRQARFWQVSNADPMRRNVMGSLDALRSPRSLANNPNDPDIFHTE